MKLSTVLKTNNALKGKINQQIKKQSGQTSISTNNSSKVKVEGSGTIEGNLKTQVNQKLTENNFISAPLIDKVKSSTIQNISSSGMNALIHQNDGSNHKLVDDGIIKGGYRVVNTLNERDAIDCCYRKLGMIVMVVGDDLSFTEYMLTGELCSNDGWVLYQVDNNDQIVFEEEVILTEDYSILDPTQQIQTQRDLNKVLKEILEQLINTPVSGDKHYTHDQYIAESTWIINHPLNKKVSVTITDTAGTVVEGEVTINDGSQVIVKFNAPFKGEAILN